MAQNCSVECGGGGVGRRAEVVEAGHSDIVTEPAAVAHTLPGCREWGAVMVKWWEYVGISMILLPSSF